MKKNLIITIVAFLSVLAAKEVSASCNNGEMVCGDNCCATLDANGVLTISGSGNMYDYSWKNLNGKWGYYYGDTIDTANPFYNNSAIKHIKFTDESSITRIGTATFADATSLISVDMPNITTIGNNAFEGNLSLTTLNMPNLTTIEKEGFLNTPSLATELPASLTSVGTDAFMTQGDVTLIIPDSLDFSGWDEDALNDSNENFSDGLTTFRCKNNSENCKNKIQEYIARASGVYSGQAIIDMGDHRECFRTSEDEENVSYYHTGTECAKLPESGNITCASGYADYNGNCYAQLPFSKKRWTPAEAAQWLHDGNDNFVVLTFKK